jgi:RimJ/RimL family protein N-acetyltransferase
MKPDVRMRVQGPAPCVLRSIGADDIECLRKWKNDHRQFFFHKAPISAEEQQAWFRRWSQNVHDHMFIVVADGGAIGCLGVRVFEGTADAYNIILGDKRFHGRGIMSAALHALGAFALLLYPELPVRVRVLATNPAVGWYARNGFRQVAGNSEYVTLEWDRRVAHGAQCTLTVSLPFARPGSREE